MCGIAGILDMTGRGSIDVEKLQAMSAAQSHRGPDQQGIYLDSGLGFAHRRLAIIDISSGRQPLSNEDRSVWVTFNGEIYNFAELAKELAALGHQFKTRSDTETIVHAWEEWGTGCLRRFRGMFAFGLWDKSRQLLLLARDHLGIKPLCYSELPDGTLAFASELKALLTLPAMPRAIDPRAVEDFFALGYIPDPKSIYRSARKLPPGHFLMAQRGSAPRIESYWDVEFKDGGHSFADASSELKERVRNSVGMQLMTEVPLGAFLSGGVDSSSVVAMMAGMQDEPVRTCSIAFAEASFDESIYARKVAEKYRTSHSEKTVASDDFDLLDELGRIYDEPYADSSALPTYRLCQLAKQRVTVALSGDGGDENFAGYRSYCAHMRLQPFRSALPAPLRSRLCGALASVYPKADWAPRFLRGKRTLELLAVDLVEAFARGSMIMAPGERSRLYRESFARELQGYSASEVFHHQARSCASESPLSLLQYLDLKIYLPCDILTKVDRASMAHSLEVRVPLLDHELVEWSATLPPHFQYCAGRGKRIFRHALSSHLPAEILDRPKMGFSIPLARWLRGPLRARVEGLAGNQALADSGVFDMGWISRIATEHLSSLRDHSASLWSLLVFESFQRQAAR